MSEREMKYRSSVNTRLFIGVVGVLSTTLLAYLGLGVHSIWPGLVAVGGTAIGHVPFSKLIGKSEEQVE